MTNRFMISVAVAALLAGTGFANAQGTGTSGGSTVQQGAPSSAGTSATPMNRDAAEPTKPSSGMKATQSDDKAMQPKRIRSMFTFLIISLVGWAIASILIASVREHAD